jgi:hypothetical protein
MAHDMIGDRGAGVVSDGRGNAALVEFWRPLVWSAIVGGAVAALGIQIILTLLGVGLGAAMTNPASDASGADAEGAGMGAVAWLIASGVISFGIGGFVAGCMSGVIRTGGGAMHGVLAWALAAVLGATVTAMAGSAALGGLATGAGAAVNASAFQQTIDRSGQLGSDTARAEPTEAEARAAAERAAEAAARAALWTGVAFLLSMVSAGIGGTLGRRGHVKFFPEAVDRPSGRLAGA